MSEAIEILALIPVGFAFTFLMTVIVCRSWRLPRSERDMRREQLDQIRDAARALLKKTAGMPDTCPEWEKLSDLVGGPGP